MPGRVFVVGVGMTNFLKPSKENPEYYSMAAEAGRRALADAGVSYEDLDQVRGTVAHMICHYLVISLRACFFPPFNVLLHSHDPPGVPATH